MYKRQAYIQGVPPADELGANVKQNSLQVLANSGSVEAAVNKSLGVDARSIEEKMRTMPYYKFHYERHLSMQHASNFGINARRFLQSDEEVSIYDGAGGTMLVPANDPRVQTSENIDLVLYQYVKKYADETGIRNDNPAANMEAIRLIRSQANEISQEVSNAEIIKSQEDRTNKLFAALKGSQLHTVGNDFTFTLNILTNQFGGSVNQAFEALEPVLMVMTPAQIDEIKNTRRTIGGVYGDRVLFWEKLEEKRLKQANESESLRASNYDAQQKQQRDALEQQLIEDFKKDGRLELDSEQIKELALTSNNRYIRELLSRFVDVAVDVVREEEIIEDARKQMNSDGYFDETQFQFIPGLSPEKRTALLIEGRNFNKSSPIANYDL